MTYQIYVAYSIGCQALGVICAIPAEVCGEYDAAAGVELGHNHIVDAAVVARL